MTSTFGLPDRTTCMTVRPCFVPTIDTASRVAHTATNRSSSTVQSAGPSAITSIFTAFSGTTTCCGSSDEGGGSPSVGVGCREGGLEQAMTKVEQTEKTETSHALMRRR